MKTMVVNTRQPYPLPWDPYGYRAVIFTLGIPSRLERVFYYQVPQESSSTRFVVKSSLTGLTPFKHTASRSSIGGGNYG